VVYGLLCSKYDDEVDNKFFIRLVHNSFGSILHASEVSNRTELNDLTIHNKKLIR